MHCCQAKNKAFFWSFFWRSKDLIQQKCYLVTEKSSGRTKRFEKMEMFLKTQWDAARQGKTFNIKLGWETATLEESIQIIYFQSLL